MKTIKEDLQNLIQQKYSSIEQIPPHSRLNHIPKSLIAQIPFDSPLQKTKSILDIVIVSVILDAGAGNVWKFKNESFDVGRSEGIAIAAFHMFLDQKFSAEKGKVDSKGLKQLSLQDLKSGFQISEHNNIPQFEKRYELLQKLADQLQNPLYFPQNRPSDLLDILISEKDLKKKDSISFDALWALIMTALGPIWPQRNLHESVYLGDVWESALVRERIPFHKLQQWLVYSIVDVLHSFL